MRTKTFLGSFIAALFMVSTGAFADIDTLAKQAVVIDVGTGTVLLDKDSRGHMPTSSMSKVMSMYVVFDALKQGRIHLDDMFTVSEKAWRMEGSKMFIKVGDQVKVEDLIRGVIVQSGNDAVVALAEGIAGDEQTFADAMNAKAKELGLNDSHFMNASGWPDPDHYSTPHDLAVLAQHIIADFPEYFHYFSEKEFTYNKIRQANRDPLLGRVNGADGLKTGHTEIAGYGLMGTAKRGDQRIILVMNGLSSEKERADEGSRLMEWAFHNFESRKIVKAGDVVDHAKVWLGEKDEAALAAGTDVTVLLPRAQSGDFKVTALYNAPLKAPLKQGDEVGTLKIEVPGQSAQEIKLVAGENIEQKGLFGRVAGRFSYLIGHR